MSKKLILFLMVLLFGSTSFLRADEVTIGDPTATTTNSYLPTYSLYDYSFSQQIYTADEIGMSGTINDVTLWLKNSSNYARNLNVYMKETSEVTFADGTAWVSMTDADLVATGVLANGISDPVETTFTLSAPFSYSGEGNLVICFQDVTGSWSSGAASVVMTGNGYQALYAYRDGTVYDPTTPGVSGTRTENKSVVRLTIEGSVPPVPPTPTGELTITPDAFELGDRPVNGWMEPFAVKINNGGNPVTITASMSNTAGVNAFAMSEEINDYVLNTDEELDFTVNINNAAPAGEYAEEFTLFSVNNRDITTVPVTATFYTAGEADIVETAKTLSLSYAGGVANFSHTPANLHANYFGYNQNTALDAVYQFTLAKDAKISVTGGTFIGIYNKVLDFHPTAAIMPVAMTYDGTLTDATILAGQYYMIVAGDNITTVEGTVEQLPAPTELVALSPVDGATEVAAPVTLTWEGGENAAQYQVLFGTSPVNMDVVLDWTLIDDNYGSYTVASLEANTQYFWQIKAKNTNGTVQTARQGFTSTLTAPYNVTASEEEIFTDGTTLIKWKHNSGTISDLPETQIGSGTSTNSYLPTYNLYNYSLSEQIYTGEEIGEAGIINSISFYPVGAITRNLKIYLANTEKTSFTSGSDWVAMTEDDLVYEGNVDMVANTWVTIQLNEPFEFDGSNLLLAVTDHTGTWTSSISYYVFDAADQAINIYQDSAPYSALAPAGAGTVRAFKNQIVINKEGRSTEPTRSFIGYNVYYGDVKANTELITEREYLLGNLPYNVEPGHNVSVTAVYDEGESAFSTPVVVKVSGYGTFTGQVTELISGDPVAGVTVTFNGKDEFNNTVSFEGTTNLNGVYTINNVKAGNYIGTASLEGMEPSVSDPVVLAYEATETVDFVIHEEYKPVLSVYATEIDSTMSKVQWSLTTNISGGGSGGGSATTFTEGFEGGFPTDWTRIDGNNDGITWTTVSEIPTAWSYYAGMTLDWYRTGSDAICSGSYINGVGAVTPDEYLVTPQVNIANGSTFSFWAAATDAGYPADHFGVAISDDATNWTMLQEWTLTGKKGANGGAESRNGNGAKLGTWYNYSVDLSSYAGQKYIAIRHFNCYDQYIMTVDDIELSNGTKDRSVQEYALYRKAILKETEVTEADSTYFGTTTDTLYADFDWNNVEPGLYQYGVSAIYPSPTDNRGGNRDEIVIGDPTSSTTNSYLPTYSLYEYSLTQQIYTADEIGIAGTINTLTMWLKNSSSYARNINVYMKESDEVTFASGTSWISMTDGDLVASFTLPNGISSPVETAIALSTPFNYSGNGNLVICCQDVTGSWSSGAASVVMTGNGNQAIYAYRDGTPYNTETPGVTGYVTTNKSVIKLDITAGGGGGNDNPVTPITWSNILPKDMETTVTVNAIFSTGSPVGTTVLLSNTFENLEYTATLDETGSVTFEDFRKGNYVVTVEQTGYNTDYNHVEVAIWDDTTITAHITEKFEMVPDFAVSGTGFARWTNMLPEPNRVAERYHLLLEGVFVDEMVDNFYQFDPEVLTVGETYTASVAVVYTTGMSDFKDATFTYIGCENVTPQIEELAATHENCEYDVILTWNGGQPTPPTPPTPPTGDVVVKLTVGDVWGDGTGYQMLLDNTHSLYGTTIPTTGALSTNCSGNEGIYSQFSHKIPTNADGNCTTSNIVLNNSVEITIPAGTYDWCITNPTPGDRIWIAAANGNVGGRYDDYVFEGGHTYEFTVSMYGSNDGVDVTITGGKGMYQPNMSALNLDVRTTGKTIASSIANADEGFGASATNMTRDWLHYDSGTNSDAIGLTSGGGFYWGIMFPGNTYEGTRVTKIAYFDYAAHTGSFMIYQGGTSAPGTLLYTQAYNVSGTSQYIEIALDQAVEIDNTQSLWLVMHNNNGQYVAAIDETSYGVANASCISTDGSTWYNTISAASGGSIDGNWNLRIFTETGGTPTTSIVPNKYNVFFDGEIVGATAQPTFTYVAPDREMHNYAVMWVSSNYDMSCIMDIDYAATCDGIEENDDVINSIYPNPTSAELYINATAMKHVTVFNAMGQMVYDQDVDADNVVLHMNQYEAGVYMVNVITENGSSVKRVTVVK